MQNIVLHLDMNSYFASVAQQDNPKLRGVPVGVCEHLGGIIIGASREAKRYGITTGTPVWEARKKYPKIVLLHTQPDRYRFYTKRFIKVAADYADHVDVYSIDELFLDLTKACNVKISDLKFKIKNWNPWLEAISIAQEIKQRFKTEVGDFLSCSIGIASNKILAKIASDLQKPDGLVVVESEKGKGERGGQRSYLQFTKDDLYRKLKLTDVPGIGQRLERQLNRLDIKTLSDLRDYPESRLVAQFGIMGRHLHHLGQLEGGNAPVVEKDEEIKSMGHMYTLPQEFRQPKYFVPVLYKLCEMVGRRLRRKELMGNLIHFYFSTGHHEGFGKSIKLGYFTQDGREIFFECMGILSGSSRTAVRLIGVSVAGLTPVEHQLSLFGSVERGQRLFQALDRLNEKYGDFTVCRVPVQQAGKVIRDSVGFGRTKELD